jgi:hypothetical protein
LLLTIWTIVLFLLVATSQDLSHIIWAQKAVTDQDASASLSNELLNRLDTVIELLEQTREGRIVQLYLTIIVFMMGLAFVIFGLYIGQEKRLSTFTRRLYLIAYFALIVPITVILVRYIINTILSGALDDPALIVAFLLLIPVAASYVLMLAKARHDILSRP